MHGLSWGGVVGRGVREAGGEDAFASATTTTTTTEKYRKKQKGNWIY